MASKKYAYYNKGNKIAIVEQSDTTSSGRLAVAHCTIGTHTNKADCEAAGGEWIPGSAGNVDNYGEYKSPVESVSQGLEIEYTYAPTYNIHRNINTGNVSSNIWHTNGWFVLDGYLAFVRSIGGGVATWNTNSATSGSLGDSGGQTLDYIVVEGNSRWNGLHRIQTAGGDYNTLLGGILKTYTKADTIGPYYTAADFDLSDAETVFDGGGNPSPISIGDAGFEVGDYVWMSGNTSAAINNGVFTVSAVTPHNTAASSTLTFDTRYYMPSRVTTTPETELSAAADFTADTDGDSHLVTVAKINHEVSKIYTDVKVMNDESFEIDITRKQSLALMNYLRARIAEDAMDVKLKEYYMKEFRKSIEESSSSRNHGPRFIQGFSGMRK